MITGDGPSHFDHSKGTITQCMDPKATNYRAEGSCTYPPKQPDDPFADVVTTESETPTLPQPSDEEILKKVLVGLLLITVGILIMAFAFQLIAIAAGAAAVVLGSTSTTLVTILGVIELAHVSAGVSALLGLTAGIGGGFTLFGGYALAKKGGEIISDANSTTSNH